MGTLAVSVVSVTVTLRLNRKSVFVVDDPVERDSHVRLHARLCQEYIRQTPTGAIAATTALAILPLIVSGNLHCYEIEHPMAIVIMGGLISSTFLTLFVLPAVYLGFGARASRDDRP